MPGLPVPRRRTFACALRASAHSEASALRHPACACRLRRLSGHGQPLADEVPAPIFTPDAAMPTGVTKMVAGTVHPAHVRDDVPGAQHP